MTGAKVLTIEEFITAAETHGGDLARWPADLAGPGRALLDRSEAAQEALAAAAALDLALEEALAPAPPPEALTARILADAAAVASRAPAAPPVPAARRDGLLTRLAEAFARPLGSAAACALGAAFGLWLGYAGEVDIQSTAAAFYIGDDVYAAADEDLIDLGFTEQEDAL